MKRLIVMRHAKSAWDTDAPSDHARPLNSRGRRDAPKVGAALRERGWVPELVLSSDSQRTRETWAGLASELGDGARVVFSPALYHAGTGALQALLEQVPEEVEIVLALGHNPGWEVVVAWLSGQHLTMKTASSALLVSSASSWQAVVRTPGGMRLVETLRVREL